MPDAGNEKDYKDLYDKFMALKDEDITYCNMPLDIAAAEATQLGIVAGEDRQKLLDAGIDHALVDTLKQRAGAFTFAAANYELVVNADPEATRLWKELSPKGYDTRKYLLKFYTFAFRKHKDLTESVDQIKHGRGDKDMLLDLLSTHILGRENLELLEKMKMFDRSMIEKAKDLHDRLSDVYARANIDPKEVSGAKNVLHHAYAYYKQAADEVKAHGQFVFEGTERYDSYVSEYRQSMGEKPDTA